MSIYSNDAANSTLAWEKKNIENSCYLTDRQVVVIFKDSNNLQSWCDKHALTKIRKTHGWNIHNTKTN